VKRGKVNERTFTYQRVQLPPPPKPTPGGIKIEKKVDGDPTEAANFTFLITGPEAYTNSIMITGAGSTTINDLTPGAYTISEVNVPPDYTAGTPSQNIVVSPGETENVTFTNYYLDPETPHAYINKSVALYDGVNMPAEDDYTDKLTLTQLGKKVMYRIQLFCNSAWVQEDKSAGLFDIYSIGTDKEDITDDLYVMTTDGLYKANEKLKGYPGDLLISSEEPVTFYYFVELPKNGIYTNTAYLYETEYFKQTWEQGVFDEYPESIASSSAVVTVNYNPPDPEPDIDDYDGDNDSVTYYNVTYYANYPPGTETSGTEPSDTKKYTYNSVVTIKGITEDMRVGDYIFKSWNTKPDGTGIDYQPGATFRITSDITLYAQWELGGTTTILQAAPAALDDLDDVPKTGTAAPLNQMLFLGLSSLAAIYTLGRKKPGSN